MVAVTSAHPIHQLPHGLQVNWRRPSLRLYRHANAVSHRDDIAALVEATDVFDVLEIKKVEQFDDRRFKFRAVEAVRSVRELRPT